MALAPNGVFGEIDERFTCEYIAREAHLMLMYFGKKKLGNYGYKKTLESPRDRRIIDYWGLNRNGL